MSRTLRVWQYVGCLTEEWHDGGALLIIADDAQAAWLVYRGDSALLGTLPKADLTYTLAEDAPETVLVFPDSGCC